MVVSLRTSAEHFSRYMFIKYHRCANFFVAVMPLISFDDFVLCVAIDKNFFQIYLYSNSSPSW